MARAATGLSVVKRLLNAAINRGGCRGACPRLGGARSSMRLCRPCIASMEFRMRTPLKLWQERNV